MHMDKQISYLSGAYKKDTFCIKMLNSEGRDFVVYLLEARQNKI